MGEPVSAGSPDLVWEAARLLVLGLNPIPVESESKKPVVRWKAFQSARFIESDTAMVDKRLTRWWRSTGHQVAVLTGELFDLVVVDADDTGACRILREHVTRGTVSAKTRKGFHVWYRHPGGHRSNRAGVAGVHLDVRGDGGYVVVPPSTGKRWIVSPHELWPPAPMPESLRDLIWPAHVDEAVPRAASAPRGGRYALAALEAELAAVSGAPEGGRNDVLNRSAFAVARFVVSGELPAATVVDAFLRMAAAIGLGERESRATLASAISGRRRG
jgi:hypothetical protein